jgi:ribosomal protein S18
MYLIYKFPISRLLKTKMYVVFFQDVLILSQFLDPSGEMLPQEITGLCGKQHKQVDFLVERSKRAGEEPCMASEHEF